MVAEATTAAAQAGLLGTLGIDYKLFLAQLLNFGLVVFVIWKWVYTPLLKVLDERTAKIEQGLKDAKESGELRASSSEEKDAIVAEARANARKIVEESEVNAQKVADERVQKTREEVERIVTQGKDQLQSDREKMVRDVKAEIADILVMATEKIAGEKLDVKKDASLIEKALKEA